MHPENTSQYICKNAGNPILRSIGIIPYQRPSIITPESKFANKRNDIDSGFANSPIIFIGKSSGKGSKSEVKVVVDGKQIKFDSKKGTPFVEYNNVYLPVDQTMKNLGFTPVELFTNNSKKGIKSR